ncbi:MAG TPA: glycoside hydrolase family 16 protein [Terriglobales bacterium]
MLSSRFGVCAIFGILLLTVTLVTSCGGQATETSTTTTTPPSYRLVWSDEFSGADGSAPEASKWSIQTGGNGWGNNELEYYTARSENVEVQGGNLVITAIKENYTGADGVSRNYTSARLQTKRLFSEQYGRFEASLKIPKGQGMWPAFWMLGSDIDTNPWPACGEIDIMENIGKEPALLHGSLHGPGYAPGNVTASYTLPSGALGDGFHLYAVEWDPQQIRFYVDSTQYATFTPSNLPSGSPWEFNKPFFILLNVAVGGSWPGPPDQTTQFPQQMLVDYVRVYQKQ